MIYSSIDETCTRYHASCSNGISARGLCMFNNHLLKCALPWQGCTQITSVIIHITSACFGNAFGILPSAIPTIHRYSRLPHSTGLSRNILYSHGPYYCPLYLPPHKSISLLSRSYPLIRTAHQGSYTCRLGSRAYACV